VKNVKICYLYLVPLFVIFISSCATAPKTVKIEKPEKEELRPPTETKKVIS
jgi:hypothetical protein